ncbi:MAG TPA: DedA family protein [Pseudonocardiaceae bacterium]|jgi:membrane-associated protein
MNTVSWLEHVAKGSPVVLMLVIMLAFFVDSLAVIGAVLPGDILLLVPAAAVGPSGSLFIIVGAVAGTVMGYSVSYLVGRRTGRAIRHSWLGRRVGARRWEQAERLLRGPAGRTLALVQFMPGLNYLIPLLAGTLHVPMKRFVQLTAVGAVAYATFYVSLGALAGETGEATGQSTGQIVALLTVSVTVAILGFTVLARAVRRMADEADPLPGEQVDEDAHNVADSQPCSATAFSTGTGSRCP